MQQAIATEEVGHEQQAGPLHVQRAGPEPLVGEVGALGLVDEGQARQQLTEADDRSPEDRERDARHVDEPVTPVDRLPDRAYE